MARPDFPSGWFAFGFSDELAPGKLLARTFLGNEVTVFRTKLGRAYAVDSYCPHLGAHFDDGGQVQGETLVCGYHGFAFNGDGICVRTAHDVPIPPRTWLGTWHLREMDGLLLVYYHPADQPPAHEIPSAGMDGWTKLVHRSLVVPQTLQQISETRSQRFECHVAHELGYTLLNVPVPLLRLDAQLWLLPAPIDENRTTLRLGLRLKKPDSPLMRLLSQMILYRLARDFVNHLPYANKKH